MTSVRSAPATAGPRVLHLLLRSLFVTAVSRKCTGRECRGNEGEIGYSVTSSTAPRPSMCASPSPTCPSTSFPASVRQQRRRPAVRHLSTAYEVEILNGGVKPGDTVIIVGGAGPIGLAGIATARMFSPGRDHRGRSGGITLEAARELGGADAVGVNAAEGPEQLVELLPDGLGQRCSDRGRGCAGDVRAVCAPGWSGRGAAWPTSGFTEHRSSSNCRTSGFTTSRSRWGWSTANTTPLLLKLVASGRLNVDNFATHHFKLHEMMDAYDTFGRAAETKALKVIIDRSERTRSADAASAALNAPPRTASGSRYPAQ